MTRYLGTSDLNFAEFFQRGDKLAVCVVQLGWKKYETDVLTMAEKKGKKVESA